MGKSRGRSHKQARNNPTGLVALEPEEGEVLLNLPLKGGPQKLSHDTIKSLSKQLQSASVEDRDCACNALVGLIRNGDDSHAALHEGLIKILGPLLLDTSHSVCHSAASALHSIVANGGDSAITLATEHDILTPLVVLLKRIPSQWKPIKDPGAKIDTATATFVEAISILTLLSESSTLAVDRLHKEGIVTSMIAYLDERNYGPDVTTAVAQFLATVTEDQGEAVDYASTLKDQVVSKILEAEGSNTFLKTLGAMILLNLNQQAIDSDLGLTAQGVVDVLASSLSQDHRKAASTVMDYLPINRAEEEEDESMEEGGTREAKLTDSLEAADRHLSTQIKALEILTNLCCPADSDSLGDDEFYDSCSEGSVDGVGIEESTLELNPQLKEAFLRAGLFETVVSRARLPAENIIEALFQHSSGKVLLKKYETLQCRAFLCLCNMVATLGVEEMGGGKQLFDIWCSLAVLAFGNLKSDEILEAATASMRAIIHKLARHQEDIVQLVKVEDVASLCQQVAQCNQPQARVNLLQVLGTLGSMAAGTEPPLIEPRASIVRGIGQLLVNTACMEPDLWITAEAMDALFDVFKEDHSDGVALEIQLVERLRTLAPGFKHRVHAQRRSLPADHLPVVMTAKDNLLRFIKYKNKMRSSAGGV